MSKIDDALSIRDVALDFLRARGKWQAVGGSRRLHYGDYRNDDAFVISHRSPFQKIGASPKELKSYAVALAVQHGQAVTLPYGLDIWWQSDNGERVKVLNIEWSDDGHVDVVSYRKRGQWEADLRRVADDGGAAMPPIPPNVTRTLSLLTRDSSVALSTRDAIARPTTWNAEAATIDAVVASNAPVPRRDQRGDYLEILDVSGADLSALIGAQVLDGHRAGGVRDILGVVEAARVEGNEIVATLRLSSRPEVAGAVRDIGAGIIRNLSVGYSVEQWAEGTADGKRTRTAMKWTPKEVSFVGVPADRNARTRSNETMNDMTISRQIRTRGNSLKINSATIDDLIDRNATLDEANAAFLDAIERRGGTVNSASNTQTFDNPEFFRDAVVDAMVHRIDPTQPLPEQSKPFAGVSMMEVGRVLLQRSGINTMGWGADAIYTRLTAPGTTSDYAAIMTNVLYKTLRIAYTAAPSGLKKVARQTTNTDFRAKMRIMLDSTGLVLEPTTEAGEFRHGQMVDAAESYAVATYGKLMALTRKAIVNDDLNAFGDVARRFGVAAAQFEATQLANLLISNPVMQDDSKTLFHSDHGNINTVTGAAPSVETLSAARLAMRKQTGKGGGLISVTPRWIVVGPDLETSTEKLVTEFRPVTMDAINPFSSIVGMIVEPRLPAYGWYVWADLTEVDALEYAHLSSAPGPQIESRLGWEVDGIEFKIRLDFGAGFVDWRGVYFNAGH